LPEQVAIEVAARVKHHQDDAEIGAGVDEDGGVVEHAEAAGDLEPVAAEYADDVAYNIGGDGEGQRDVGGEEIGDTDHREHHPWGKQCPAVAVGHRLEEGYQGPEVEGQPYRHQDVRPPGLEVVDHVDAKDEAKTDAEGALAQDALGMVREEQCGELGDGVGQLLVAGPLSVHDHGQGQRGDRDAQHQWHPESQRLDPDVPGHLTPGDVPLAAGHPGDVAGQGVGAPLGVDVREHEGWHEVEDLFALPAWRQPVAVVGEHQGRRPAVDQPVEGHRTGQQAQAGDDRQFAPSQRLPAQSAQQWIQTNEQEEPPVDGVRHQVRHQHDVGVSVDDAVMKVAEAADEERTEEANGHRALGHRRRPFVCLPQHPGPRAPWCSPPAA
jgi:hypothetical protein